MSKIPIYDPPRGEACPHGEDCALIYKLHRFLNKGEEMERLDRVETFLWIFVGGFAAGLVSALAMLT
jgi:hypothetical protein